MRRNKKRLIDKESVILSNIPNFLTIIRFILAFVVISLIVSKEHMVLVVAVFAVAAITDFLDGTLARHFKWTSEFGRKADMVADRFLWAGTALAFLFSYVLSSGLDWRHWIPLVLMMTREIVSAPFALIAFFSGNILPKVRFIAKTTTLLQGFALPSLLLSINYPLFFYVSWPLSIAAAVVGFRSAMYYIHDTRVIAKK